MNCPLLALEEVTTDYILLMWSKVPAFSNKSTTFFSRLAWSDKLQAYPETRSFADGYAFCSRSTALSTFCCDEDDIKTEAPFSMLASAAANPSPDEPPMMRTLCPFSLRVYLEASILVVDTNTRSRENRITFKTLGMSGLFERRFSSEHVHLWLFPGMEWCCFLIMSSFALLVG